MSISFARFLSYVLHPALLPTYLFGVLFFFSNVFGIYADSIKLYLLGFLFLGTFCLPASAIWLLYKSNYLTSLEMPTHKERRLPFILVAVFYTAVTLLVSTGVFTNTLLAFILIGISQTVCLAAMINIFYKLSMHSVGICGILGILFALQYHDSRYQLFYHILALILLTGAVLSARLALQAHNITEILVGTSIGLLGGFVSLWWLLG